MEGHAFVPAPAGVVRVGGPAEPFQRGRPRTRGGSGAGTGDPGFHRVVPAPAGVVRSNASVMRPCLSRPRTRDGRPISDLLLSGELRLSPYTRGY